MSPLQQHLEALIFCAEEPISEQDLLRCLQELYQAEVSEEELQDTLQTITQKYAEGEYVFQVLKVAGGYQFLTKPAFQHTVAVLLKHKSKKRLSTSALETLAIVAYKQPVTKTQIESIRGVNSDYAIQRLLEKELIGIIGKSDAPGRPMLYGTGKKFMQYFGINDLKELPQPKDFMTTAQEIGQQENPSE